MSKLLLRRGTLQDLQNVIPDAGEPFYITDTKEFGVGDGINVASDAIIKAGSSRNIGEIVASTIPLTDTGLHLLDGALISGSGIYSEFVTYIAGLVSSYPNIFETEANWQSSVTTYGVCGKFVYTAASGNDPATVRLPKITGFTEGTIDPTVLGNLVEAGLPNITGAINDIMTGYNLQSTGAFSLSTTDNTRSWSGTGGDNVRNVTFNASNSSSIYGNSNTVQPQSIKVLYYIVIATTTKTDIQVDIDEIATDLNGKADVDLTNVNNSGTSLGSRWAMPSNTFESLTLGASGTTYTAPANGYFVISKMTSSSSQHVTLRNTGLNGEMTDWGKQVLSRCAVGSSSASACTFCPAKKGDVVMVSYNAGGNLEGFGFVYAQGSESEAS